MSLKGCVVIVICSILVQFFDLQKQYLYNEQVTSSRITVSISQGLMFLVYPLLGYLADVCLTRYRIIKWSFLVNFGGGITCLLCLLVAFLSTMLGFKLSFPPYNLLAIFSFIGVLISVGWLVSDCMRQTLFIVHLKELSCFLSSKCSLLYVYAAPAFSFFRDCERLGQV